MQNKRLHEKFPESSTGSGFGKTMTKMTCNAGGGRETTLSFGVALSSLLNTRAAGSYPINLFLEWLCTQLAIKLVLL